MLDPLYTKIGNFFHLIGNFGIIASIIIAVTIAILYTVYKKTDWHTVNGYYFVRACKKWLLIAILIAIIGGILHMVGAYYTPNTDSMEKQIQELD